MAKKPFQKDDRVGLAVSVAYDDYSGDEQEIPLRYSPDEEYEYGVITDVLSSGKIVVKWDNEYYDRYNQDPVDANTLLPEEVMKKKLDKLRESYDKTEGEIEQKMKEAAKLIKEANKLAKKTGHELAEMYDVISPLVGAMDASGWRTSSWGC